MMEMSIENSSNDHTIEFPMANFNILSEFQTVESPISTAVNLYNTRWKLVINPNIEDEYRNFLCCCLERADEENFGPDVLHIESEFSLVGSDGSQNFKQLMRVEFQRNSCFGLPMYVKLEDIFNSRALLLPSDTLTFRCKLRLLPPKNSQTSQLTCETNIPIRLMLDNIRSIAKKDPITLPITNLLSLKVSMNMDKASAKHDNTDTTERETFLHIVMVKDGSKNPVYVSCWVKLLNAKSEIVVDKKLYYMFSKQHEMEDWIFPYFIDTSNLGGDCIKNDGLFLDFDIAICDSQSLPSETLHWEFKDNRKRTTLGEDLYETKKYPDVALHVGNKLFSANKCVLAARSPRFEEIFKLLMTESTNCKSRIVKIADVDEKTMELLLKFIYTDNLEDMNDKKCLLLYSAAQKYKIQSLQFKCARFLKGCLSLEEANNALLLAEEFCDSELKMAALYFFERDRRVFSTP